MRSAILSAYLVLVTSSLALAAKNVVLDAPRRDFTGGISPVTLAAADFNEDGKMDLVVSDDGDVFTGANAGVDLLIGTGTDSFRSGQPIWTTGIPSGVVTADFNGDGHQDIAIASGSGFAILLGNGDGTFKIPAAVPGVYGDCAATGDFNQDGFIDIAVCDASAGVVQILLGYGDGTFHAFQTYAAGTSPGSITVADLNRDGHADLAVSSFGNPGSVSILYGKAAGTFRSPVSIPTPQYTTYVAVADVN